MAAAPFAGYNMVLVEPAMGFHQGSQRPWGRGAASTSSRPWPWRAPRPAPPLAVYVPSPPPRSATSSRFHPWRALRRAVSPTSAAATCAATGYGDGPVALAAVSVAGGRPGAFTSAGVLKGTAGPGRFHAMSVVAKAGDEPTDPADSDVKPTDPEADSDVDKKVEEYYRKRKESIDAVLCEIHNFNPYIAMPAESFAICRDENMLAMFGRNMKICYGSLLQLALEGRPPTPMNREALIMIGKDLKMVELECHCQEGFLKAETLDRAVASLKALRATWLGWPEDDLKPLNTSTSTPRLPVKDDPIELVDNYFVFMKHHLKEVMQEVLIFVVQVAAIPRSFEELDD